MRGRCVLTLLLLAASLARAELPQPQERRVLSVEGLKQAAENLKQTAHSLWQRAGNEGMPQPLQCRLFSVEGLKQAAENLKQTAHSLWQRSGKEGMRCTDCVQLATGISLTLYTPPDVDSDDPNIAVAGPGRRMRTKHKEPDILAALDGACSKLAASQQLIPAVQQDCERLVGEQRAPLENHIFDRGTEGLATFLCVERLRLCDWHDVVDSGEL